MAVSVSVVINACGAAGCIVTVAWGPGTAAAAPSVCAVCAVVCFPLQPCWRPPGSCVQTCLRQLSSCLPSDCMETGTLSVSRPICLTKLMWWTAAPIGKIFAVSNFIFSHALTCRICGDAVGWSQPPALGNVWVLAMLVMLSPLASYPNGKSRVASIGSLILTCTCIIEGSWESAFSYAVSLAGESLSAAMSPVTQTWVAETVWAKNW